MIKSLLTLALVSAVSFQSTYAGNWPGYRGPKGDGSSVESISAKTFGKSGPKNVWKAETANGFSSFAIGGGKVVTLVTEKAGKKYVETCVAFDQDSGKKLWAVTLGGAGSLGGGGGAGAKTNKGGDGSRSTPAIDGDKVYVFDAFLVVHCLKLDDGSTIWKRDLVKENGAQNIKWENAASPVIDGEKIYVAGGGKGQALLALNKADGKVIWKVEDDQITHATPIVGEVQGVKQVIFFTQTGLVAVTPGKGEVLWRYEFPFKVSTAASPVIWEDIVYCSAGYGVGAGAVKISKSGSNLSAKEIWRTPKENVNHWSTPVVKDGYLYGMFSFKEYGKGPLACVDIRTGEMKWKQAGFGPGNVILTKEGNVLALSDAGELVLVDANSSTYKELGRAKAVGGKCWSTPAVADGKVFVRSTTEGGSFALGK
ncbi:MAG: PQQ-binding-like beta-propeller repeat protein [Verrucomicrobia bacterium]|nr:PQQ-binding-like beta-propeller repeat protein [Verrucomicrobiota bacterium]